MLFDSLQFAIGSAQVMDCTLMMNVDRPYTARSISEFWRRWHVSLSTWFGDYRYILLGGNRVARPRLYRFLLLMFLVSGLWHGARWTIVVGGALHGAYLIASLATERARTRDPAAQRDLFFLGFETSKLIFASASLLRRTAYACAVLPIMTLGVFQSAKFINFQF